MCSSGQLDWVDLAIIAALKGWLMLNLPQRGAVNDFSGQLLITPAFRYPWLSLVLRENIFSGCMKITNCILREWCEVGNMAKITSSSVEEAVTSSPVASSATPSRWYHGLTITWLIFASIWFCIALTLAALFAYLLTAEGQRSRLRGGVVMEHNHTIIYIVVSLRVFVYIIL